MEGPILPSVRQWLDWKLTGCLPRAGGTLDQDPVFMRDLREIEKIMGTQKNTKAGLSDIRKEIDERTGRRASGAR